MTAGSNELNRADFMGVCGLAYIMLLAYALARPPIESLYLDVYPKESLPFVWGAVAVVTVLTVTVYNRLAARLSLVPLLTLSAAFFAGLLVAILAARAAGVPHTTFALYVWKDVHVVVLLEIVWSFANVVFPLKTARWAYGLFCACGSLGGITGGLVSGPLADGYGTDVSVWAALPVLLVLVVFGAWLGRGRTTTVVKPEGKAPRHADGLRVLSRSRYLPWMLLLILLVQVALTLLDYAFNESLLEAYPDKDDRTRVGGQVYAFIDGSALVLQLGTRWVIGLLGVRATLLAVPAVLGAAVLSLFVAPRFALFAVAKVASKAFDYSVFKAAKEMLYLPLSYAEKTRGKAMVDMLTYRVAKGGASALLLLLLAVEAGALVLPVTFALVLGWIGATVVVTRRYRQLVSRDEETR